MSYDYKLNKSELTRLKRQEKLYEHYLPVLKVKQEQLQIEQNRIRRSIDDARRAHQEDFAALSPYVLFFGDSHEMPLVDLIQIDDIKVTNKSIAGVSINVFLSLSFKTKPVVYFHTAPWLIRSLPLIKAYLQSETRLRFLTEENRLIERELRKASQKVNLFDKVLIPQTQEAIKRIKISLGDEQVAMVTRGKIAKAKKRVVAIDTGDAWMTVAAEVV